MRKNLFLRKLKQNKAFTMQELMITVAIIIVLLAISFVSITNWTKTLKMTELENYARSIYLEAQYQLSNKEVEGGLPNFYEKINTEYTGRFLTMAPQDFDVDSKGDAWKQLCFIRNSDPIAEELFSKSTNVAQMPGSYLIELNPQTGDVYGVFYWESDVDISYTSNISALLDRSSTERYTDMLGYYGGDTDTALSESFSLSQLVSLVNEEELYVKVSFEKTAPLVKYYASALEIDCTVTDEYGNAVSFDVDDFYPNSGEKLEFYLLLDSMMEGHDFKTKTDGKLVAGDNLTIEIDTSFSYGAYEDDVPSVRLMSNSLFAGKTKEGARTTITMNSVRHLRNLDAAYYTDADDESTYIIQQVSDIDFAGRSYDWNMNGDRAVYVGIGGGERPVTFMTPITNDELFVNTGENSDVTTVMANGYEIKNVVIEGTDDNVGLFAKAENVTFTGLRIEDITVKGEWFDNVGTLVGNATDCTIVNCGAYLINSNGNQHYSLVTIENSKYSNEMERRYDELCVMGASNVGGLVGKMSNSDIIESFSAVKVKGSSIVGGLVGSDNGSTFTKSYSSGDILVSSNVGGGFIGEATNTKVTNAYSTGNLYVNNVVGGFVGTSKNSYYDTCAVYGQILNKDGSGVPNVAGGFVGSYSGDTYVANTCKYLQQESYNNRNLSNPEAIVKQGYSAFLAGDAGITTGDTYPYAASLIYASFPFADVTGSHYGNWPSQYSISTSLVYYEVYEGAQGDEYGYYCVTTLSNEASEEDLIWVLDSLQDRECKEDGYAILSMYNLSKYTYDLDIGSTGRASTGYKGIVVDVRDSYSADADASKTESVRLRQQSALYFKGYKEQLDDYSDVVPEDFFVVDGMYLYQLPYDLQCTDRFNVENFYDRFTIYNGIPKTGDGSEAEAVINSTSFFYCPHFAKTAVNPNTAGAGESKLENPVYVAVRSARQLNQLSRYTYYWNDKGGMATKITYRQETNINFGTYNKVYCGIEYDLMTTDKSYSNRPIGQPDYDDTAEQFRNNYNGQGHQIIDFCVNSPEQFVGLFGEIRGATLENIVMTVSAPGKGKIISTYVDTGSSGFLTKRGGLGALVGLAYEDYNDNRQIDRNTIRNCTSAGYVVEYQLGKTPSRGTNLAGISIGGLVGLSMSPVTNSSAENDVRLVVDCDFDAPVHVGGLAGSLFFKTFENLYAGGTIDIEFKSGARLDGNVNIAGVCPGYMMTWYTSDVVSTGATYRNIYSYTEILTDDYDNLYGAVGTSVSANSYGTVNTRSFTISNCYYLEDVLEGEDVENVGTGLTAEELADLSFTGSGSAHATKTFPINTALIGKAYPFPAFVKSPSLDAGNSVFVHYGDWPADGIEEGGELPGPEPDPEPSRKHELNTTLLNEGCVGIFYYELYYDGTYGIYAEGVNTGYNASQKVINTLAMTDEAVQESGYGLFYKNSDNWNIYHDANRDSGWKNIYQYGTARTIYIAGVNNYQFRVIDTDGMNNTYEKELRYPRASILGIVLTYYNFEINISSSEISAARR